MRKNGHAPIKILFTKTGGGRDLPTPTQNYSLSSASGAITLPQQAIPTFDGTSCFCQHGRSSGHCVQFLYPPRVHHEVGPLLGQLCGQRLCEQEKQTIWEMSLSENVLLALSGDMGSKVAYFWPDGILVPYWRWSVSLRCCQFASSMAAVTGAAFVTRNSCTLLQCALLTCSVCWAV